ncbi:MAG: DUF4238 domain-containing protein [Candidatus Cloacimonetes bacterium]|nr:DUF4238 domain-containing protein [Candidatus Cloacimonadota bacterium]
MNEPIKHHFIPQFILRKFTHNNDQIYYWNKESSQIEVRNTKSVYMVKNLYRDEKNHPTDPAIIENKFAQFESEIATLFQGKIVDKDPIVLTRTENEKLRKFLFLLSFRSSTRKQQYIDANFDDTTKEHLKEYVVNDDYIDLWLREIEMILDTENYNDIQKNDKISWTIKTDFWSHLTGYYMTFVTPRGQDFIIGDVYPTAEIFPIGINGANLYPHFMFPITPHLMLLLNHVGFRPESRKELQMLDSMVKFSKIKENAIKTPSVKYRIIGQYSKEDTFIYKINKIYSEDAIYLNSLALNEVRKGFSYFDFDRIHQTLQDYQLNPHTSKYNKNDYSVLLNNMSKK